MPFLRALAKRKKQKNRVFGGFKMFQETMFGNILYMITCAPLVSLALLERVLPIRWRILMHTRWSPMKAQLKAAAEHGWSRMQLPHQSKHVTNQAPEENA